MTSVSPQNTSDKVVLTICLGLRLAQLHSMAVDYCKTGVPAQMTPELRVKTYPHWAQKPARRSYKSKRVLGQLCDEVEKVEARIDPGPSHTTFDSRILNAYSHSEELLAQLQDLKHEYDENMCRIMAQYGIATEFEVFSAFVMAHNREVKEYKFAEELGGLMSNLKFHYKNLCCEAAKIPRGVHSEDIGPLVAAVYTVTAREAAEQVGDPTYTRRPMAMISFPWIFFEELTALPHKVTSAEKPSMFEAIADLRRLMKTKKGDMVSQFTRLTNPSGPFSGSPEKVEVNGEARKDESMGMISPHGAGEDGAHDASSELSGTSVEEGERAVGLPIRPAPSIAGLRNRDDAVAADQEKGNNTLNDLSDTMLPEIPGNEGEDTGERFGTATSSTVKPKEQGDAIAADQEMGNNAPLSTASALDMLARFAGE